MFGWGVTGKIGKAGLTGSLATRMFKPQGIADFKKQGTEPLFFVKEEAGSPNDVSCLAGW